MISKLKTWSSLVARPLVACTMFGVVALASPASAAVGLDLVLCMDSTGSIGPTDWILQKKGTVAGLCKVLEGHLDGRIRVTVIEFPGTSGSSIGAAGLKAGPTVMDRASALGDCGNLGPNPGPGAGNPSGGLVGTVFSLPQLTGGGTNISSCIELARTTLCGNGNCPDDGITRVIDISTDGAATNPGGNVAGQAAAEASSAAALAAGIDALNVIGVGASFDLGNAQALAYPKPVKTFDAAQGQFPASGDSGFVLVVDSFPNFEPAMVSKIKVEATVCGNAIVEGGEDCDEGSANGTPSSCCSAQCTYAAREKSCRASAGPCDAVEKCTGASALCPPDLVLPTSTVCRASAGACDAAENCNGISATCPDDSFLGAATVCRAASGICDVAEKCSGASASCPADAFVASNTLCRASTAVCDAPEFCPGDSGACPADTLAGPSTVCRAATGDCDAIERCSGSSPSCPADALEPSGASCDDDGNECTTETCDGATITCHHDPNTGPCAGDGNDCTVDTCDGAGTCGHTIVTGPCDDHDRCTLGDECIDGVCLGTDVVLKPACEWVMIGGSGTNPAKPKQVGGRILGYSKVSGSVCGATVRVGLASTVDGDIVATESTCSLSKAAVELGPLDSGVLDEHGAIVTGGGPIVGKPGGTLLAGGDRLEYLDCNEHLVPFQAPPAYYDTTGTNPLVDKCNSSRDELSVDVEALDDVLGQQACSAVVDRSITDVVAPAVLRLGPDHPESLSSGAIVKGERNYVCVNGDLTAENNAAISIDDGGDTATQYVIVIRGRLTLRLHSSLELVPPLDASRVLVYGKTTCRIGDQVTGAGALLCPNSKLRMQGGVEWQGSLLSGNGYVQIGMGSVLTHVPLMFGQ